MREMQRVRTAAFGLVLTGVFAACTLIDPLDDISGGSPAAKDSGRKDGASASSGSSGTSSGAADDDDDLDAARSSSGSTSSSSGSTILCSGPQEVEPNDTGTPSTISSALSCGTISGPGDIDRWTFKNSGTTTLQIFLKVQASTTLNVSVQSGGDSSNTNSGSSVVTSLAAGATLTLQITTLTGDLGPIAYRIEFAAN